MSATRNAAAAGFPLRVTRHHDGRVRVFHDLGGLSHYDPAQSFELPANACAQMDRVGVHCAVLGTHKTWNEAREAGWLVALPVGAYFSPPGIESIMRDHAGAIGPLC